MAYDFLALAACLRELQEQALGAKINKIHQPNRHTVIMRYYGRQGQGKILFCTEPTQARLQLTAQNPENPAKAPLFLMVLRKWLEGSTLKAVQQTPYERVAELHFATRNDLGDPVLLRLVIEIMGKHSNLILVDHNGLIIDGIRRYDSQLSRYREVLPTVPYLAPPPQHKTPPPFTEEALAQLLLEGDLDLLLERALGQRVAGLSPQLATETLLRAGLSPHLTLDELGEYELNHLTRVLNAFAEQFEAGGSQPTLLIEQGRSRDFAAFEPLSWQGRQLQPYPSMSEALDAFYTAWQQAQQFQQHYQRLERVLKQHIGRLTKKIGLQQADLAASLRGDRYKEAGDLLAAHLYQVQQLTAESGRGLTQASLPSFADPEELIEIDLDAALTPQQNVQRYYRLYNKCRKAHEAIVRYLSQNEQELEYLENILQSLQAASLPAELTEIERELRQGEYLEALTAARGNKAKKPSKESSSGPSLPPRRYRSQDGFIILIGRNNKQNERLTLKTAAAHDIWLHAQKIPGSHAIIVTEGKEVPDTTLTEAAAYAAWFSQAQDSPKTPVDYTLVSQVKKPQGAKPGMVIYFQQQTVYVAPRDPGPELTEENE